MHWFTFHSQRAESSSIPVGFNQLGREREKQREKQKKTLIWSSKQKAVDRNGELYEVTFT